jgi:hypothetical protein
VVLGMLIVESPDLIVDEFLQCGIGFAFERYDQVAVWFV